jgi:hypothetical protein
LPGKPRAGASVGRSVLTFAIIIRSILSASMDNAYPRTSNKHSKLLLSASGLRHNWHIDNRSLRDQGAFAPAWQIHIVDR